MTIYIGPPGSLRAFPPEAASPVQPADDFIGGSHIGLTGSRTVDLLGLRKSWTLAWQELTLEEFGWLLAAFRRELGPLYVVDLLAPNQLPPEMRPWTPVGAATAARMAAAGARGLLSADVGWQVPAGSHLSGVVPILRDSGVAAPYVGSVAVDTVGVSLQLQALGPDGRTVVAQSPLTTAAAPDVRLVRAVADLGGGLPATAAFLRMVLQVPAGTARAYEAQLAIGAQPYTPRGGSARVLVDSWEPRQVEPPMYAASIKLEAL